MIQAIDCPEAYPHGSLLYLSELTDTHVAGRGLLEGNGRVLRARNCGIHIIEMYRCHDCSVDGIIQRDSGYWANHIRESEKIRFTNFKIINYRPPAGMNNSDGLNFDSSKNCCLYNGFFYTGDDNCVVKGTVEDGVTENIIFEKYVGYSNSAACKIGTETENRLMEQIRFTDVDIVGCDRVLVVDGFDHACIRNILFENVYVERIVPQGTGAETSRLLEFVVTDDTWRPCVGRCKIRDVRIRNLFTWAFPGDFPSLLEGRTPEFGFENIELDFIRYIESDGIKMLDMNREGIVESCRYAGINSKRN